MQKTKDVLTLPIDEFTCSLLKHFGVILGELTY